MPYVATVKSTVEILQNFVTFSEYTNFTGGPRILRCLDPCIYHSINLGFDAEFAEKFWNMYVESSKYLLAIKFDLDLSSDK